jgi:ribosomal protein S18 acetylase RimI-like enzyme
MVSFREAHKSDYKNIAHLHAKSWQENYRGVFSDHFLDVEVLPERRAVWKERCLRPQENQYIVISEEDGILIGFCCAYIDESNRYGSYLDNLHVSTKANGKGLGTMLMQSLVREIRSRSTLDALYLWVLDSNHIAINFYDKLSGQAQAPIKANDIGDKEFWKIRYVWDSLQELEKCINTKLENYEHRRI